MRIPPEVQDQWASLRRSDDRAANLESVRAVRTWLAGLEEFLAAPVRLDDKEPKIYGHADSNARGITTTEFDGVRTAKLRYWLEWWSEPTRSPHGKEEAGRDPKTEIAKLKAEIEAREALRD